jgi:hypothetical protein
MLALKWMKNTTSNLHLHILNLKYSNYLELLFAKTLINYQIVVEPSFILDSITLWSFQEVVTHQDSRPPLNTFTLLPLFHFFFFFFFFRFGVIETLDLTYAHASHIWHFSFILTPTFNRGPNSQKKKKKKKSVVLKKSSDFSI